MIYLKEYNNYIYREYEISHIEQICEVYKINNYTINEDGLIDVDGDVDLSYYKELKKLPLRFNRVSGDFSCKHNGLTTLEGCPKEIGRGFYCQYNKLNNLVGCPKEVGKYFDCSHNEIVTLEDSNIISVGNWFNCSHNKLNSLIGCPTNIVSLDCSNNNLLVSLEGCPKELEGFDLQFTNLPKLILDNSRHIRYIIKWQDEYSIWNNGKLDEWRFNQMMKDRELI